jgi:hypothetical protein
MTFYLGLDLGQAADYSALAIIEQPIWNIDTQKWVSPTTLPPWAIEGDIWYRWQKHAPGPPPLWLRTLYRYPLRTSYPDVVADVIRRLGGSKAWRDDAYLVIDGTGLGAAVVDMFRYSELPCEMIRVVIHGGVMVNIDNGVHVPKRDLIGAVQAILHTSRLQVAGQSDMTDVWVKEMQNYRLTLTANGHDTYNARSDSLHDDLVLAVALAAWYRGWANRGE